MVPEGTEYLLDSVIYSRLVTWINLKYRYVYLRRNYATPLH